MTRAAPAVPGGAEEPDGSLSAAAHAVALVWRHVMIPRVGSA